jgi:adenosylcobinamide-phosphate synthase
MDTGLSAVIFAYILDLAIGDPQWRWHPVRLIGGLIEKLEKVLNRDACNRTLSGVMLVILIVGSTVFVVWAVLKLAVSAHPALRYIVSVLLIYFALSVKALAVEADRVRIALADKDIQKARQALSMIVGRETDRLDEPEVIRATIETVAESTMDGIIAPLGYLFLGGPVLMWAYKAVNTLDSMVGHRSRKFIEFGKAAAMLDGLANIVPAKITALLISASSLFLKKDFTGSLKWGLKYFFKGAGYNSEMTEAAMAGGLGVRLGGMNFYDGAPLQKPFIGDEIYPLGPEHIRESIRIAYISSGLFMALGISIWIIMGGG